MNINMDLSLVSGSYFMRILDYVCSFTHHFIVWFSSVNFMCWNVNVMCTFVCEVRTQTIDVPGCLIWLFILDLVVGNGSLRIVLIPFVNHVRIVGSVGLISIWFYSWGSWSLDRLTVYSVSVRVQTSMEIKNNLDKNMLCHTYSYSVGRPHSLTHSHTHVFTHSTRPSSPGRSYVYSNTTVILPRLYLRNLFVCLYSVNGTRICTLYRVYGGNKVCTFTVLRGWWVVFTVRCGYHELVYWFR